MTYHDWNSVKTKLMSSMKAYVELGVHNKIHKAFGRVKQKARVTSPVATCRLFWRCPLTHNRSNPFQIHK